MAEPEVTVIPESEWVWCAYPGHFVAANQCRMHLNTRVGDYRISTVGAYFPIGSQDQAEIGLNRWSETFVFMVTEAGEHGEGVVTDWSEVAVMTYGDKDGKDAERGHMEMCHRIANGYRPMPYDYDAD